VIANPNPLPPESRRPVSVGPIEALEDVRQMFGGDSLPVICDPDSDAIQLHDVKVDAGNGKVVHEEIAGENEQEGRKTNSLSQGKHQGLDSPRP